MSIPRNTMKTCISNERAYEEKVNLEWFDNYQEDPELKNIVLSVIESDFDSDTYLIKDTTIPKHSRFYPYWAMDLDSCASYYFSQHGAHYLIRVTGPGNDIYVNNLGM